MKTAYALTIWIERSILLFYYYGSNTRYVVEVQ